MYPDCITVDSVDVRKAEYGNVSETADYRTKKWEDDGVSLKAVWAFPVIKTKDFCFLGFFCFVFCFFVPVRIKLYKQDPNGICSSTKTIVLKPSY